LGGGWDGQGSKRFFLKKEAKTFIRLGACRLRQKRLNE
jgi:hypothetical protein